MQQRATACVRAHVSAACGACVPSPPALPPSAGAGRGPACIRTLMVSMGWMVVWEHARAMEPAITSFCSGGGRGGVQGGFGVCAGT